MTVRVVLADDHPIVRQGLRMLLESKPDFQVVAETSNGIEVLPLVKDHRADLLILDLMLPGLNGLEITRLVTQQVSSVRVIILSLHNDDAYVTQAIRNGASGYIVKDSGPIELMEAVQKVMEGQRYLSPVIADRLSKQLGKPEDFLQDPYEQLTTREREVLQLVAEGYTGLEIAGKLSISRRTAEQHRANVIRKLGLQNQREIVRYAFKKGIISLDD